MPGRRLVTAIACAMLTAAACSQFDSDASDPAILPDGGATSETGSGVDGSSSEPTDAGRDSTEDADAGSPHVSCELGAPIIHPEGPGAAVIHAAPSAASGEQATVFGIAADATHYYWLEQRRAAASGTDIYNALGSSRLLRKAFSDDPEAQPDVLLDNLGKVTHLARSGKFLYFVSDANQSAKHLMRLDSACSGTCKADPLWTLPSGQFATDLLVAPDHRLVYQSSVGEVITIGKIDEDGGVSVFSRGTTGEYAGTAVGDAIGYTTSLASPKVSQFNLSVPELLSTFANFPDPLPSEKKGATQLAADCEVLYAFRDDRKLWRAPLTTGATFELWVDSPFADVFDLQTDADYVYAAGANLGGVVAIDRTTGRQHILYKGNVWHLTVTPSAVVWAEHQPAVVNGGAIYMLPKSAP